MTGFLGFAFRSFGTWLLVLATSAPPSAASTPSAVVNLGANRGSVEIVRCHFEEGRIVLRRNGELHVLHQGDELATTGLRVMTLTADRATLLVRGSDSAQGLRIIRVTTTETGTIVLREIATDPAALGSSPDETSNPMSSVARIAAPAAPPGTV